MSPPVGDAGPAVDAFVSGDAECPSKSRRTTSTGMTAPRPRDRAGSSHLYGATALSRYGEASEIAATVAHLASAEAGYITGAAINVDGGFTA